MDAGIPTSFTGWLALLAATGVVTLAWSTLLDWLKSRFHAKADAKYLAIKTAIVLEAYAIECWRRIMIAKGNFEHTHRASYADLPPHPILPEDVNWRVVSPHLAAQVFAFVNETSIDEAYASYASRFEGNDFDFEAATQARGKAAWDLANAIRSKFGLPSLNDQRARLKELD